jgi:hypothetical protein
MLVKNGIITTEARRAQRSVFYLAVRGRQIKSLLEHGELYLSQRNVREHRTRLFPMGSVLWSNRLSRLDHKKENPFAISAALR